MKVLVFVDVNYRGSSKLPGILGSLYSRFHNWHKIQKTNVIIWTLCISLDIIFRGFNEIRNPLRLARIILLSLLKSKFKNNKYI